MKLPNLKTQSEIERERGEAGAIKRDAGWIGDRLDSIEERLPSNALFLRLSKQERAALRSALIVARNLVPVCTRSALRRVRRQTREDRAWKRKCGVAETAVANGSAGE